MWKYPDNSFRQTPPATVVMDGYRRSFADLDREQRDGLGYNEAVAIARDPYTAYETRWAKGEDLICREEIVSAIVDEAAKAEAEADAVRIERDRLLRLSDWTQLTDCVLDDTATVLWQSYRQALRDVPQQAGFPGDVEWPVTPEVE